MLVINQSSEEWEVSDEKMKLYAEYLKLVMKEFTKCQFFMLREKYKMADALSKCCWEGPARSKIKPLVLLYSEDPCYEKKQEPVMVATVEEKPWFYDVQKYLQDREYPDHPLTRQSSES
ncbi:UNVERIFIED_CONTAM: hypothetical protein Sangu_2612200 [Sesamum angustifolium]|uniref:Uncharacterized protein n=1 Tax=Sesamum angustifolium TaxID=2727405 RepID=A0AAW2J4V1_9LAMI